MLKIATAEADITPPIGTDLSGFALRENPSVEVYDSLKVRWLALSDAAGNRMLLGAADVLSFSRETFRKIRTEIREAIGDADLHIALATSHTHSGPATVRLRHCGKMNRTYLQHLKHQIVESAGAATKAPAKPVIVKTGSSDNPLNINRRQGESGPVDTQVQVVQFLSDDARNEPVATLLNYACHPVVMGHESRGISADYPGYACAAIESKTGAPCLFLNGACGDVNPRNAHRAEVIHAQKMGKALGDSAIKAMKAAGPTAQANIQWRQRSIALPVNVPKSIAEIERRIDMLQERFGLPRDLFKTRVQRDIKALKNGTYPKNITIELSLLTLTPECCILFVPGELFTSIGFRAKKLAAPGQLVISGFSNGSVGYLSDRQAYADGGYEPYFANFFYDFPEFQPDLEDYLLHGIDQLLNP